MLVLPLRSPVLFLFVVCCCLLSVVVQAQRHKLKCAYKITGGGGRGGAEGERKNSKQDTEFFNRVNRFLSHHESTTVLGGFLKNGRIQMSIRFYIHVKPKNIVFQPDYLMLKTGTTKQDNNFFRIQRRHLTVRKFLEILKRSFMTAYFKPKSKHKSKKPFSLLIQDSKIKSYLRKVNARPFYLFVDSVVSQRDVNVKFLEISSKDKGHQCKLESPAQRLKGPPKQKKDDGNSDGQRRSKHPEDEHDDDNDHNDDDNPDKGDDNDDDGKDHNNDDDNPDKGDDNGDDGKDHNNDDDGKDHNNDDDDDESKDAEKTNTKPIRTEIDVTVKINGTVEEIHMVVGGNETGTNDTTATTTGDDNTTATTTPSSDNTTATTTPSSDNTTATTTPSSDNTTATTTPSPDNSTGSAVSTTVTGAESQTTTESSPDSTSNSSQAVTTPTESSTEQSGNADATTTAATSITGEAPPDTKQPEEGVTTPTSPETQSTSDTKQPEEGATTPTSAETQSTTPQTTTTGSTNVTLICHNYPADGVTAADKCDLYVVPSGGDTSSMENVIKTLAKAVKPTMEIKSVSVKTGNPDAADETYTRIDAKIDMAPAIEATVTVKTHQVPKT